jgi:hypothetical protein
LGKKGGRTGGRGLVVCAVVSFPFGMDIKEQKPSQCLESLERDAKELDIVMNFLTQEEKWHGICEDFRRYFLSPVPRRRMLNCFTPSQGVGQRSRHPVA